jgi:small multidrug resistance family-3 protein
LRVFWKLVAGILFGFTCVNTNRSTWQAWVCYSVVATFQPANFGRVYAAYGGVFVVMSVLWGWLIDGKAPDRFDVLGGSIVVIGVVVMMYWPRT